MIVDFAIVNLKFTTILYTCVSYVSISVCEMRALYDSDSETINNLLYNQMLVGPQRLYYLDTQLL